MHFGDLHGVNGKQNFKISWYKIWVQLVYYYIDIFRITSLLCNCRSLEYLENKTISHMNIKTFIQPFISKVTQEYKYLSEECSCLTKFECYLVVSFYSLIGKAVSARINERFLVRNIFFISDSIFSLVEKCCGDCSHLVW